MAKKESKKTRESQYAEILARVPMDGRWTEPLTLNDVTILGFRFKNEFGAQKFHYDLMNAHVAYLLFDGTADGTAIVVIRGTEQADRIRAIAEQDGGTEYKPNLKQ